MECNTEKVPERVATVQGRRRAWRDTTVREEGPGGGDIDTKEEPVGILLTVNYHKR